MTLLLLALLAAAWAWWGYVTWRGRREGGGSSSISTFNNHLSVLERTSPDRLGFATVDTRPANQLRNIPLPAGSGSTVSPVGGLAGSLGRASAPGGTLTLSEARRRRRLALTGLSTALLVSLMLAGVVGGLFLWLVALSALALAAYGGLLAWTRQVQAERQQKVRYLDQPELGLGAEAGAGDRGYGEPDMHEAGAWWERDEMVVAEDEQAAYASSGS